MTAHGGGRPWRTIAVLTAVYTYAFVDRQILALLVEPIKAHLGLTDTQMSLLLGLAFAFFYSLLNLPAGYLVDRFNRRNLMAAATVAWSGMTVVCGLSQSFWQLAAGRAGVGLAEAAVTPASFSMIRDAVPPAQRGRAFGLFAMGPYFGNACSLLVGGAIVAAAAAGAFAAIPGLSALAPWQLVLVLVGIAGIPIAALLFAIAEPVRRQSAAEATRTSLAETLRHLRARRAAYLPLVAYVSLGAIFSFGAGAWLPAMVARTWGLQTAEIGVTLGLINLVCAPLGLLATGIVMDRLTARGRTALGYGALAAGITGLAYAAAPFSPGVLGGWLCICLGIAFKGASYAIGAATLAAITPSRLMGQTTAIYFLVQNIVGQALGPTLIAGVSDLAFEGPLAIGRALAVVSVAVGATSIAALALLAPALRALPQGESRV